ncbi:hypothetical protein Q3V30_11930 [Erwinia pyri]|uniref:Phage tail protein n=1 Tax=Erwinia pyri TaxID=3062598 RepID=A0AA50DFK5_9GAMM|nr:hypothetical protein [Erwinia sp. DE2]WLS77200.1 hypothetical protein Q3V30_11930 [Erwinia sp. DE2]
MMADYALIKDGMVQNVVVWDGEGNLFEGFDTYEIQDGDIVGLGYSVTGSAGKYKFKAPVVVVDPEELAGQNLATAQSEYDRASKNISDLNDQIADEDYSGTTEEIVKKKQVTWTSYRKSLRAYIANNDGSVSLPSSPEV